MRFRLPRAAAIAIVGLSLVLAGAGGLGFAASAGDLGSTADGYHGSDVMLVWTNPTNVVGNPGYVLCSVSLSPTILTFQSLRLGPGGECSLSATIRNTGSLPASLYDMIYLVSGPRCPLFVYADNIHGLHSEPTVGAGGTFVYHSTFSLSASAGNACQGKSAYVTVVITGTQPCPSPKRAIERT